jgi:dipeptidyl aminopeptidase/acylaminoacyl peptidase
LQYTEPGLNRSDVLYILDTELHVARVERTAYSVVMAWSLDGQQFAYIWREKDSKGVPRKAYLVVNNADSTEVQTRLFNLPALQKTDDPEDIRIKWSADGQYLAVQVHQTDFLELYIVSRIDLSVIFSERDGNNPAWSPQGHDIAYTAKDNLVITSPIENTQRHYALLTEIRTLLWSPDGQYLALEGDATWPLRVYTRDGMLLSGTDAPDADTAYSYADDMFRLSWSADSHYLLFIQDHGQVIFDLAAFSVTDKSYHVLMENIGDFNWFYDRAMIFLNQNKLIVPTINKDSLNVYLLDLNGTKTLLIQNVSTINNVLWSPTDDYVGLVTMIRNEEDEYLNTEQLTLIRTDGTDKRVLRDYSAVRMVEWRPGTNTLFYITRDNLHQSYTDLDPVYDLKALLLDLDRGTTTKIFQRDEESGSPYEHSLTHATWNLFAFLDGKHFLVAYLGTQPIHYFYSALVDVTGKVITTFDQNYLPEEAVSLDGKMIVFIMPKEYPDKVDVVRIVDLNGSTVRDIEVPEALPSDVYFSVYWMTCP